MLGPTPADALRTLPDDLPAVLVPAFLSSGYHVRVDIPGHVAASGHRNTLLSAAMGQRVELAYAATSSRRICWRTGSFRTGCGRLGPTWWPRRSAPTLGVVRLLAARFRRAVLPVAAGAKPISSAVQ